MVYPPWKHNFGFNRFRQFHLTAYGGHGREISSPQGITAVKLSMKDAEEPGDDDELTVFGVNAGRNEIIYNRSLFELGFYTGREDGSSFVEPVGIAADAEGTVAVADRGGNRVVLLYVDSQSRLNLRRSVTLEDTGSPLLRPTGVALEEGYLYIADAGNDRIAVVDTAGNFLTEITDTTGALDDPFGIAVIAAMDWNHYDSRFLVATCGANQRLTRISLSGDHPATIAYAEISDQPGGFYFAAIDYFSNVFVTDPTTGCIYKFDRNLNYLTRFECGLGDGGKLDEPRGIAIYRRFGQVFIAENTGTSYYWVGTDVLNLSCRARRTGADIQLTVRFLLTEHSNVTARLESEDGGVVNVLSNKVFMEAGSQRRTFVAPSGLFPSDVADCDMYLSIEASPVYASRNFLVVEKRAIVR